MQSITDFLRQMPDWLGQASVGLLGAVVGWFANLIISSRQRAKDREEAEAKRLAELRDTRRQRLIELRSLLYHTRTSFENQAKLRNQLKDKLEALNPGDKIKQGETYEDYFVRMAPKFSQEERGLHAIVRGITISSLRPGNRKLIDWIGHDNYFQLEHADEPALIGLAHCINQLHAHLWVWMAKYDAWRIETDPDHALVYLADEKEQGTGFPTALDPRVEAAIGRF